MAYSYTLFKTYTYPHQAAMELNKLRDEGIAAFIGDEVMGSFSFLGAATGGVKIYVAKKDVQRAVKVLSTQS
jgi:type III secretory pathway lipoprotein EscJ